MSNFWRPTRDYVWKRIGQEWRYVNPKDADISGNYVRQCDGYYSARVYSVFDGYGQYETLEKAKAAVETMILDGFRFWQTVIISALLCFVLLAAACIF